jgi:hypothetical protein
MLKSYFKYYHKLFCWSTGAIKNYTPMAHAVLSLLLLINTVSLHISCICFMLVTCWLHYTVQYSWEELCHWLHTVKWTVIHSPNFTWINTLHYNAVRTFCQCLYVSCSKPAATDLHLTGSEFFSWVNDGNGTDE